MRKLLRQENDVFIGGIGKFGVGVVGDHPIGVLEKLQMIGQSLLGLGASTAGASTMYL